MTEKNGLHPSWNQRFNAASLALGRRMKKRPGKIVLGAGLVLGVAASGLIRPVNFSDVLYNYLLPLLFLIVPELFIGMPKTIKWLLRLLGGLWFAYLLLFYLIGFHNPAWGN